MATKKVRQNEGQNQEQPVSDEIRRAAKRIGHEPAEPAEREAPELGEPPFDGPDTVNPNAAIATLVATMFEAPNGYSARFGFEHPEAFLKNVLLCAADDFSVMRDALIGAGGSGNGIEDYMARFLLRAEWRVHLALEFKRRFAANDSAGGDEGEVAS
jgi:hypothetical protein